MISISRQQAAHCRRPVLVLAILLIARVADAAELNDIVADSIQAHPEILEQVHVFRQADRDRDIAVSGWRPSVDLQASTGNTAQSHPSLKTFLGSTTATALNYRSPRICSTVLIRPISRSRLRRD
jgi:outer membrane protein TolC